MLCSEQELNLAEASAGIMILPEETAPGKPLADALGLSDWLLEVEITPNRGDCLSVLGVAREIASITGEKVVLPDVSFPEGGEPIGDLVRIAVSDPDLCPRYTARAISGVTIALPRTGCGGASACAGSARSTTSSTSQLPAARGGPADARLRPRPAAGGPDRRVGPERNADLHDAGRVGAEDRSRDAPHPGRGRPGGRRRGDGRGEQRGRRRTTRVVFESAHFSPPSIRRTAKRLGLSSEASYRFERGVDPAGTVYAADRAVSLLSRFATVSVARE